MGCHASNQVAEVVREPHPPEPSPPVESEKRIPPENILLNKKYTAKKNPLNTLPSLKHVTEKHSNITLQSI